MPRKFDMVINERNLKASNIQTYIQKQRDVMKMQKFLSEKKNQYGLCMI